MSQSTASRIVASLEQKLGVSLFTRTTRAVTLTEAGADYLTRVEAIIHSLEEADHAARGNGELRGVLRIATSSAFAIRGILPVLAGFTDQHPKLRVEFVISDARQDLVGEAVDVALRVGTLEDSSAIAKRLGVAHRILVASPRYLETAGTPRTPVELSSHTIVVGPAGRGSEAWAFRKDGKVHSLRLDGRFVLNSTDAATAAAVAGLGVVCTGHLSVLDELQKGALVRVLPDWDMGSAEINIVLPAGRASKPSARAFTAFMEASFPTLEAGHVPATSRARPHHGRDVRLEQDTSRQPISAQALSTAD